MKELFHFNEDIFNYPKVIIFGAGEAGKCVFYKLLQRNVKVECFADSDPEKCGKRFMNIPIVHIDKLTEMRKSAAFIVSGRYAISVADELEKRGFEHLFLDYGNEVRVIHLARSSGLLSLAPGKE